MTATAARPRKAREITNPAIDKTAPAYTIVTRAGGLTAFAATIDRHPSTCYRWLVKGFVPAEEQGHVMARLTAAGVPCEPSDFIRLPHPANA